MIVSCEACKARYKLDDSKIAGKGAKITCPKCKNVFVVHLDEVDEPTNFPVRLPAPAPAPIVPQVEAEQRAEPPTEERAARGDVAAKAALLDFKKVGVAAWKVKVKIGLIYDFSDIKTLRKYIQDGRVTSADVISHDGKSWRQIGEIPDLDVFFIETWERLEAQQKDAPAPAAAPKAAPSDDAMAAMAAAAAAAEEPDAAPKSGAKAAPRPRPAGAGGSGGARAQRPDASGGGTSKALIAAIVLVAVGAVAYAVLGGKEEAPVTPPPATQAAAPAPAPVVSDEAKLREQMKALQAQSDAARAPVAAAADDHLLTPVDRSAAVPVDRAVKGSVPAGTPVPATQAKASSASDHESVGDDAARSGDWGTAAMAYKKATDMDARSAKLQLKLGEALLKSGDSNGAMGPLGQAGAGGQARAWKLLGDASRQQGDAAGANSYYQKYLATNPSDAAAVRGLLGGN